MNQIHIIGNLTNDPVTHTTQAGKTVCTFTVAVNRRQAAQSGQQETDYFRVNAWSGLGENCARYLQKGKKVAVIGRVGVSTYKAQNGEMRASMDVYAQEVEFLSPAGETRQNAPETPKTDAKSGFVQVEEEIPF